jgi:hypothetical protein
VKRELAGKTQETFKKEWERAVRTLLEEDFTRSVVV